MQLFFIALADLSNPWDLNNEKIYGLVDFIVGSYWSSNKKSHYLAYKQVFHDYGH